MHSENALKTLLVFALTGSLLLMLLLAWNPGISFSEDLGRHLLLGRIISEERFVPQTNYLTYTHPDHPFVNHHWLSAVVFYQLHRFVGYNGLIIFKMVVMSGALALSLIAVRRPGRPALLWLAALAAAVLLAFRGHIRPELFTFMGIAFLMCSFERIREGARWPWFATVAAMWLWSNAHIYFVVGLFLCVVFALERVFFVEGGFSGIASRRRGRRMAGFREEVAWIGCLSAVCILNPNGLSGLLYPLHIFSDYAVGITENASALEHGRKVINPALLALLPASALALWAAWSNRKSHPATSVIVLAALASSWIMIRSVPLLALTLPVAVASVPVRPAPAVSGLAVRAARAVGWAVLAGVNVLLAVAVLSGAYHRPFPSPIGPVPFGFDDETRYVALRELGEAGLPGHIFTDYNIGSLAEYNLWPRLRGYVDNRPEAFPGAFWRTEYVPALALGVQWEEIRARRGIHSIIVSLIGVKDAYTRELMRRPEWGLVHLDSLLGVWVLDAEPHPAFLQRAAFTANRLDAFDRALGLAIEGLDNLPLWRRHVEADRAAYECYALICIGETPRAWPHIWALHRRYPDYQIVHELMRVSAPPERVEDVKRVMQARARRPVAAKQVLDWGAVWEAEGRLDEAGKVYRRGRVFFPLSPELRAAQQRVADALYLIREQGVR